MEAGLFLNDKRGLEFLDRSSTSNLTLGIPQLDKQHIQPTPGEMLLYIAAKGTGKTWFCVHTGRQCRMQRARVAHYSLEMSELDVFERYMQSWFSAARTADKVSQTNFELDSLKRLLKLRGKRISPKLNFSDSGIKRVLREKQQAWGTRLGGIVVKRYPSGSLTIPQLVAHLDFLELSQKFVPQVLIVDYPDLMRIDSSNYRHSLGQIYVELRGIAVERNMALVVPTQGTRSTLHAKIVRSSDVSEDKRKVDTADIVLTYSQTPGEKRLGVARIHVEHARKAKSDFSVLISQSYDTGQYVIDSANMDPIYPDLLKAKVGREPEEEVD